MRQHISIFHLAVALSLMYASQIECHSITGKRSCGVHSRLHEDLQGDESVELLLWESAQTQQLFHAFLLLRRCLHMRLQQASSADLQVRLVHSGTFLLCTHTHTRTASSDIQRKQGESAALQLRTPTSSVQAAAVFTELLTNGGYFLQPLFLLAGSARRLHQS
jgi:uncharacterized membrane protein